MWTLFVLSFCVGMYGSHGAKLPPIGEDQIIAQGDDSCKIVISRDGIEANGFVTAWGGDLNQVHCEASCPDESLSPAIQWLRVLPDKLVKYHAFKKRVYATRWDFGGRSTLTFRNFLERDAGLYMCKAWLGPKQRWVERNVEIRYGCHAPAFLCDVSRCLPMSYFCDGKEQCDDGTDEAYCSQCRADQFYCDRSCIKRKLRCDGFYDCNDETDENGCLCDVETEFECDDGTCIHRSNVCDGKNDCNRTISDEADCKVVPQTTASWVQSTTPSKTTSGASSAEADIDYGDYGSYGEENEDTTTPNSDKNENDVDVDNDALSTTPEPTTTTKQTTTEQTSTKQTTPEQTTLERTTPEQTTPEQTTPEQTATTTLTQKSKGTTPVGDEGCLDVEFECTDQQCIPLEWMCDSYQDCSDALDEKDCPASDERKAHLNNNDSPYSAPSVNMGTRACPATPDAMNGCLTSQFRCTEGLCIDEDALCDKTLDCPFGEDEEDCGCADGEFMCSNGACIKQSTRCDSFPDCNDGSDEAGCDQGSGCHEGMSRCEDKSLCYRRDQLCDGYSNCDDGSDERNCTTTQSTIVNQKPDDQHVKLVANGSILEAAVDEVYPQFRP